MSIPTRIALKHALVGFAAMLLGGIVWGLVEGAWPSFRGLGAVGVILGMSTAWTAQEAYAAGRESRDLR